MASQSDIMQALANAGLSLRAVQALIQEQPLEPNSSSEFPLGHLSAEERQLVGRFIYEIRLMLDEDDVFS